MDIITTYNSTTVDEMKRQDGTFISIEWESLLPTIKGLIRLRDDEIIDGFIASLEGIKIKVSRKKGRKVKN